MFCRSCGENIPIDSVFCPNCGKNLLEVGGPSSLEEDDEVLESPPEKPRTRFRRRRAQPVMEDAALENDGPYRDRSVLPKMVWAGLLRLSLGRLFWAMGLAFAAIGFIVGITGYTGEALVWILFGLVLVLSSPHAPSQTHSASKTAVQDPDGDDAEESPMRGFSGSAPTGMKKQFSEEMRD